MAAEGGKDKPKPPEVGPGLYAVLKVPQNSSARVIAANHQQLLTLARVDVHLTYDEPTSEDRRKSEARIKEINHAANVLLDPVARKRYDRHLLPRSPTKCDTWIAARDGRSWPTPPRRRSRSPRRQDDLDHGRLRVRSPRSLIDRGSPSYEPYQT